MDGVVGGGVEGVMVVENEREEIEEMVETVGREVETVRTTQKMEGVWMPARIIRTVERIIRRDIMETKITKSKPENVYQKKKSNKQLLANK